MGAIDADPLFEWLRERGGDADGVRIGLGERGRGIFAARDLDTGECPLHVPADVLVRSSVVAATPYGLGLVARYGPQVLLAVWTVRARRHREPDHAAFVELFPADLSGHPLFFGAAALDALRGTRFCALMEARRSRIAEEHAWIRARLPGFEDLDATEWLAARTLVTSRTFSCGDGSGGEGEALAPVADLLNHAIHPTATWSCDAADGFRLRVECAVREGEELTVSYGPKSNARLLLGYGFTLADNPHDDIEIELGELGAFRLSTEEASSEVARLMTALGADASKAARRRAREALSAVCRGWLERLPEPQRDDGREPAVTSALAVRESERRVLAYWAG